MMKKTCFAVLLGIFSFGVLFLGAASPSLASYNSVLARWDKIQKFEDPMGGKLDVEVTWFSEEYIRALAESEADANLWTQDEKENYLYNLLKTLQIDEYIPVEVAFNNRGESMHLAPFDKFISLWIDNKEYSPADYDKRFNFKLQGKKKGYVFFPRYDDKGNNLLEGARRVRVRLAKGISPIVKGNVDFFWDVYKDNPEKLFSGKAMRQFEVDRLLKRTKKLNSRKIELEEELKSIYEELLEVQKRMDELQNETE